MKKSSCCSSRDPGGMALLFLMTLALVVVMALVRTTASGISGDEAEDVLFVDQDRANWFRY